MKQQTEKEYKPHSNMSSDLMWTQTPEEYKAQQKQKKLEAQHRYRKRNKTRGEYFKQYYKRKEVMEKRNAYYKKWRLQKKKEANKHLYRQIPRDFPIFHYVSI
jgi:hypothetical protein